MPGCPAPHHLIRLDRARTCRRARLAGALCLSLGLSLAWAVGAAPATAEQPAVQGHWAFTQRQTNEQTEHLATTPSAEDPDTWLLIACRVGGSLVVALTHASEAPFPYAPPAQVKMQSDRLSGLMVAAKSVQANEIFIDPAVMRRVFPFILEAKSLVISVGEPSGRVHDYTFSMQPNDVAFAAIRSHCLNGERGS